MYGELLLEKNSEKLIENINKDDSVYIYGIDIIEKELQETPVEAKYKSKLMKELVMNIYESIIKEELTLVPIAQYIASEYYKKFKEVYLK